jgi:hypothetical protein
VRVALRTTLKLICILSIGLAIALALAPNDLVSPLRFEAEPFLVPMTLVSGESYDIRVRVWNASRKEARIVGSLDYCGGSCVLGRGLPTAIPPHGSGYVGITIRAYALGELSEALTFYTDRPSQPTIVLELRGTVLPSEQPSKLHVSAP